MGYLDIHAKAPRGPFEWRPWLLWVGAVVLAYLASTAISYVVSLIPIRLVSQIVASLLGGVLLGLAQGVVMRRFIPTLSMRDWVIATVLGYLLQWLAVPLALIGAMGTFFCLPLGFILILALTGAALGFAQRYVLDRYIDATTKWAQLNALASVVSGLLIFGSLFTSGFGGLSYLPGRDMGNALALADALTNPWSKALIDGLLFGGVTGWGFVQVLHMYRMFPRSEMEYQRGKL